MSFKVKHMIFGKIAIILTFCLLVNIGSGINNSIIVSYADDAVTASNPLLMPLTGWLTAVAIGTGIIGKNASESANQLIANVANNLKEKEIQKSLEDENYNSPFMVIPGGSDKTPQKPNNNNKNGKWFALGTATAGASAMLFEEGAIETAMQTFNDLKAYQKYIAEQGLVSADSMLSTSSASGVALQLANYGNTCVSQFNNFLHSSWWSDKSFTPDDCLFAVGVYVPDFLNGIYPYIGITVFDNSANKVKNLRLINNPFGYNTHTYNNNTLSFYYYDSSKTQYCQFLDENNVAVNLKSYVISVSSHSGDVDFTDSLVRQRTSGNAPYFYLNAYYNPYNLIAYAGYKWTVENPWGLTNNVYNVNQTFEVNFPDWQKGIMEILGQQLQGVQIGGITSPNVTWEPTQEQIQSGTTPASVIYQYINNYQNPENIPDEEDEPDNPVVVPPAIEEPQPTNDYLNNFLLPESITTKFPFCIPFDIARALRLFSVSQREAPKWECDLNYGSSTYHVVIDLAMFNDLASFIRPLEFILFLVGLAIGTRSLIRG